MDRRALAVRQGAEIGHHIQFVGAGLSRCHRFGQLHRRRHGAEGEAHHGDQLGAGALALKGQLLPGAGHPAGGHAHPGKAEMAGFLAALAHGAAAVVGIQQGVVDQGG